MFTINVRVLKTLIICLLLISCHASNDSHKEPQIISVYAKNNTTHLYYNGTIKPIQADLIISPASGVISKLNFHYGDFVKKGDLLFTIHSPEMENQFREAISNYFRVRQSYLNSKKSMIGTEMLYKEKIISEKEYSNEKSQYENNVLNFVEAHIKLKQFLIYLPSYQQKIMNSSLLNLEEAKKLFKKK